MPEGDGQVATSGAQGSAEGTQNGSDPNAANNSGTNGQQTGTEGQQQGSSGNNGNGNDDHRVKPAETIEEANARLQALTDEAIQRRQANSTLKQQMEAVQAELKTLQDANKTEEQKRAERLQELEKASTEKDSTIQDLQLRLAFLQDNTYDWHNPQAALRLADLSEVEFKDGKVTGLDKALKKVAEDNPYLLKPKEDNDSSGKGSNGAPTGVTMGNGKKSSGSNDSQLAQRFPALRGRSGF